VIKNTLAQKAVAGTPLEVLNTKFVGMTAIAILEDPVALAQLITKFSKDYAQFKFKAGVVDGRVIDVKDLEVLVNIPSREQLISQMMFLINSGAQRIATATAGVARNLAIVIDQVREQKEQQSA
jgi:large subunit ribosomal protein L10